MKTVAALMCLALTGPAFAQARSPTAMSQGAVTLEKFNHAIEDTTRGMLQAHAQGERYIHHDIAYPGGPDELKKMNGFALLLVSAWSQSAAELPLKSVYLQNKAGRKLTLPLVG